MTLLSLFENLTVEIDAEWSSNEVKNFNLSSLSSKTWISLSLLDDIKYNFWFPSIFKKKIKKKKKF